MGKSEYETLKVHGKEEKSLHVCEAEMCVTMWI